MRTLQDIDLREEDLSAVLEAAERLREVISVERIILFGSKPKSKDDDISDVDILILTSRSLTWQEKSRIVRLLSRVGRRFDVLFDPIIHSLEEWNEGIPKYFPIHQQVENEGIVVA